MGNISKSNWENFKDRYKEMYMYPYRLSQKASYIDEPYPNGFQWGWDMSAVIHATRPNPFRDKIQAMLDDEIENINDSDDDIDTKRKKATVFMLNFNNSILYPYSIILEETGKVFSGKNSIDFRYIPNPQRPQPQADIRLLEMLALSIKDIVDNIFDKYEMILNLRKNQISESLKSNVNYWKKMSLSDFDVFTHFYDRIYWSYCKLLPIIKEDGFEAIEEIDKFFRLKWVERFATSPVTPYVS